MIKLIHVVAVSLSGLLFFIRGIWMIRDSHNLNKPWVKITPHIIDTLLLISAIMLSLSIQQYPFTHSWLSAKVIALLVYIGLGMTAFRFAHSKNTKIIAWLAALLVFAYIILVARHHNALPFIQ